MQPLHLSSKSSYLFYIPRSFSKTFAARLHARENCFLLFFLLLLPLCSKSTTGADSIPCSGFPIQKQAIPTIFHRARTTCPLFSYTEYIASLNFCLLLAYVIARYSASLASRILTSRPTYAEKLQGYKNLSPRSNTLPLAGHANTSFLTFAVPKKNLIHAFSGHWPLFFAFFVDILAIFCTTMQIRLRIRHSAPKLYLIH